MKNIRIANFELLISSFDCSNVLTLKALGETIKQKEHKAHKGKFKMQFRFI